MSRTHPLLLGRRRVRHWHRSNTIQMPTKRTKIAGNNPLAVNSGLPAMVTKDGIPRLILEFVRVILFYESTLAACREKKMLLTHNRTKRHPIKDAIHT